jgi:hypothetical protein
LGGRARSLRQASDQERLPPLLANQPSASDLLVSSDCAAFNQAVEEAAQQRGLAAIILSGYWASRQEGPRAAATDFQRALADTVASLRGRLGGGVKIVVVGTTPVFEFWPTKCLARAFLHGGDQSSCSIARPINRRQASMFDAIIDGEASRDANVVALMPWNSLCEATECVTMKDGTILYRDHSHFTVEGSRIVLAPLLAGIDTVGWNRRALSAAK